MSGNIPRNILVVFSLGWLSQLACAQAEGGTYLSGELGLNVGRQLNFYGNSNDQGSACDPVINPDPTSRELAGCPTRGTGWVSLFDDATGPHLSAAFGHVFQKRSQHNSRQLRFELEYVYRNSEYDQTSPIRPSTFTSGVAQQKLSDEIARAEEWIGSVKSNAAFANLYWDFRVNSQVSPYFGFGLGIGSIEIENSRIWERNADWMEIRTGIDLPNGDQVRQNLAGTISRVNTTNSDTVAHFQLMVGMDFKWKQRLTWGLKLRFVQPNNDFRDIGGLDQLRSHEPPPDYVAYRRLNTSGYFALSGYVKRYR